MTIPSAPKADFSVFDVMLHLISPPRAEGPSPVLPPQLHAKNALTLRILQLQEVSCSFMLDLHRQLGSTASTRSTNTAWRAIPPRRECHCNCRNKPRLQDGHVIASDLRTKGEGKRVDKVSVTACGEQDITDVPVSPRCILDLARN
jgi:hypothetical protein